MKKIILSSIASVFLFSCSNQTDVAREKIENHIDSFANDPGSYQFVRMEKPDTTRKSDEILSEIYIDSLVYLTSAKEMMNFEFECFTRRSSLSCLQDLATVSFTRYKEYQKEVDSLESSLKKRKEEVLKFSKTPQTDSVLCISHKCVFRIKNAAGGLILTEANITFDFAKQKWENVRMKNPLKD
jgi:hypothetical protein